MFEVLDFWMEMGVDGLRLDAVPYLFEREGTNCENLPETHDFLRQLRAHIDARYKDRMLLAEANQWPEDAAAYFGDGDECHMNFHFPLMPRMFMALQQERAFPILDILEQTPAIPETCQWAMFLRNHDELTLEMVTDEDRDYMYRVYADDPEARINVGIRRRLAPLLKERRKIELMNALLLSLPGTPVLYYGDEIGMGDNIYLGDRDGVRTPMQWSGDRNAGFSRANPQKLFLPVIIDPEYHYEAVNVEALDKNPQSLLWWTKRLIALRRSNQVFGRGSVEFLPPTTPRCWRSSARTRMSTCWWWPTCRASASPSSSTCRRSAGSPRSSCSARSRSRPSASWPYLLTLGPHGFYWLSLTEREGDAAETRAGDLPSIEVVGSWQAVLDGERERRVLERALPSFLAQARWFRGKGDVIKSTRILDDFPLADGATRLLLVEAEYIEREAETYVVPIAFVTGERVHQLEADHPGALISRLVVKASSRRWAARWAFCTTAPWTRACPRPCSTWSAGAARRPVGWASCWAPPARPCPNCSSPATPPTATTSGPHMLGAEQTNTSVVFGGRVMLKVLRRLEDGIGTDVEIGRYLTDVCQFSQTPALGGWIDYQNGKKRATVATLHQYVANQGDAWHLTLDSVRRSFEWALSHRESLDEAMPPQRFVLDLLEEQPLRGRARVPRPATSPTPTCWPSAPPRCTWPWPPRAKIPTSRPRSSRPCTSDRCTRRCAAT